MKNYIPCNNAHCPYGRKTVGMICPAAEMCAGFQYGSASFSTRTEADWDIATFSSYTFDVDNYIERKDQ